jgi:hypothetical protein
MPQTLLVCNKCRESLAPAQFYIDTARKGRDGRSNRCIACSKRYAAQRYPLTRGQGKRPPITMGTPDAWNIVADYHKGLTVYAICRKHDVTAPMVYRLVDSLGVPRRRVKSNAQSIIQ